MIRDITVPEPLVHFQTCDGSFYECVFTATPLLDVFAQFVKNFNVIAVVKLKFSVTPILNLRPNMVARAQSIQFTEVPIFPHSFHSHEGRSLVITISNLRAIYNSIKAFSSTTSAINAASDHWTVKHSKFRFRLTMALVSVR
jgi:hypothetical protein